MATAGYSGTPLAKKLGLKPGHKIMLYDEPDYYFSLFETLPDELRVVKTAAPATLDFIHLFATKMDILKQLAPKAMDQLKKNGMLWVSWPKKSSGYPSDLNENIIRDYLLNLGLVDVKVAAIDGTWSGLKFVYRLKDR